MSRTEEELNRLRSAAQDAWDAANRAAENRPPPGTPDWDRWQSLVDDAVAANDAYRRALDIEPSA